MKRLLLSVVALLGFGLFNSSAMANGPCHVPVRVEHREYFHPAEHCVVVRHAPVHRVITCSPTWYAREHCAPRGWHRR